MNMKFTKNVFLVLVLLCILLQLASCFKSFKRTRSRNVVPQGQVPYTRSNSRLRLSSMRKSLSKGANSRSVPMGASSRSVPNKGPYQNSGYNYWAPRSPPMPNKRIWQPDHCQGKSYCEVIGMSGANDCSDCCYRLDASGTCVRGGGRRFSLSCECEAN